MPLVIASATCAAICISGLRERMDRFGSSPAMTELLLLLLRLLRPLIRNAPDHRGIAEFLAQIIHRALGVGRAAVEHVGVVGLRARRAAR